ncbi:MAG: hypothetical protein QM758_05090 [Armatimonas sp.]
MNIFAVLCFVGVPLYIAVEFCLTGASRRINTLRAIGVLCGLIAFITGVQLLIESLQFQGIPNTERVHSNKVFANASEELVEELRRTYLFCLVATPLNLAASIASLRSAAREFRQLNQAR